MNNIYIVPWAIYDLSERVSPLVIDAISEEVYHRDYGDQVGLGWPHNPGVLDELSKEMWWR